MGADPPATGGNRGCESKALTAGEFYDYFFQNKSIFNLNVCPKSQVSTVNFLNYYLLPW